MGNERRTKARYPLELTLQYQTLGMQDSISGAGRTVNVSSSGVFFAAQHDIDQGARVKITMEWPTLLNGITPLQLVTTGKVVRSQDLNVGVEFDWYQFRTMKRTTGAVPSLSAAAAREAAHAAKTSAAAFPLRNAG
ncbi:MAG TPA: PilZ domain-containing protein [Bryobacteraceae bacterium]|nr:PilZ domain-containing protein [Bryobacteraceae bacterium]